MVFRALQGFYFCVDEPIKTVSVAALRLTEVFPHFLPTPVFPVTPRFLTPGHAGGVPYTAMLLRTIRGRDPTSLVCSFQDPAGSCLL